jgi:hypothetical protein
MREWLLGGAIPTNRELVDDLCNIEYGYTVVKNQLRLESKDDMKARGVKSPNRADALALTFAGTVQRRAKALLHDNALGGRGRARTEYDVQHA